MSKKKLNCKVKLSGLLGKFSQLEDKYLNGGYELECLEQELYQFKKNNINDPDYSKLIAHIKNKALIKNNSLSMNNMIAPLILSMGALILSVVGVIISAAKPEEGTELWLYIVYIIVGAFVFVGCFCEIIPIWKRYGSEIKRNFYEICLNILE